MAVSRQEAQLSARAATTAEAEVYRPPYLAAGIATAVVWLLYAITLSRTTAFWDTSEYIATAHMFGCLALQNGVERDGTGGGADPVEGERSRGERDGCD